jgi:hypothetical protein
LISQSGPDTLAPARFRKRRRAPIVHSYHDGTEDRRGHRGEGSSIQIGLTPPSNANQFGNRKRRGREQAAGPLRLRWLASRGVHHGEHRSASHSDGIDHREFRKPVTLRQLDEFNKLRVDLAREGAQNLGGALQVPTSPLPFSGWKRRRSIKSKPKRQHHAQYHALEGTLHPCIGKCRRYTVLQLSQPFRQPGIIYLRIGVLKKPLEVHPSNVHF